MAPTLPSGTPVHVARTPGAARGLVIVPDIGGLRPLFTDMADTLAAEQGWSVAAFEPWPGREDLTLEERLAAVGSLDDAATVAGVRTTRTPPILRSGPPPGIPNELVGPLFRLKPGEPTMVEAAEGFLVAVLAEVSSPDPASDPAALGEVRARLERAVGEDVELVYAGDLRDRANPRVNRQLLNSVAQP